MNHAGHGAPAPPMPPSAPSHGEGTVSFGNEACKDPETLEMYTYENAWVFFVVLLQSVLLPLGFYYRSLGRGAEPNARITLRGYGIMAMCWLLIVICALAASDVNHAPRRMNPFDSRLVFGLWSVVFPLYTVVRDFASGPASKLLCCCLSAESMELLGKFWDFAVCGIGSLALLAVAMWTAIGYHEMNTDIGHLVPSLGFIAYSGLLLYNAGRERRSTLGFQRAEAAMWITWGAFFDVYFTLIQVGFNGWTIGEQHLYQALMYIWTGSTALFMARINIRTGFPMFTMCLQMAWMMTMHLQYCPLLSMMHQATGMFFLIAGVFRYFERILEASFFMMMAGSAFLFSSNAIVYFGDQHFDNMSYVFSVMVFGGTWWMYMAWMFLDEWHHHESTPNTAPYAVVQHADDEENGTAMKPVVGKA